MDVEILDEPFPPTPIVIGRHAAPVARRGEGRRVAIDPSQELVAALREAYREVTDSELEPIGTRVVADGAVFQAEAGITTVYHGPQGTGAHADVESITVAALVRTTRV